MATLPKRDKVQVTSVTVTSIKIDTVNDRFHFSIKENEMLSQVDKEGKDQFATTFSEGFSCLLEDLKTDPLFQDIYIECMNNPTGCNGVDKAMFIALQGLINKAVKVTRHFAHTGDIVRGYSMQSDRWVTDKMEIDFSLELTERLQNKFDKALDAIERNDDF